MVRSQMGLEWLLERFSPVHDAWLSWIDPGGFIVTHSDAGPWRERWQVPIFSAGATVVAGSLLSMVDGVPVRVEHWLPHSVDNPSDSPRVHLVIDRDVIAKDGIAPFTTYP